MLKHKIRNTLLRQGVLVSRADPEKYFPGNDFYAELAAVRNAVGDSIPVFEDFRNDLGDHPAGYKDLECAFAARVLHKVKPRSVLDIGSYRHFVIGLIGGFDVTTLDIRKREPVAESETVITGDAKKVDLPDESFDAVVTLCALEHFGLGRYGDPYDLDGDVLAMAEWHRLLKKGGSLIMTTTINQSGDAIAYNAHRIYSRETIQKFAEGFSVEEEAYFSFDMLRECTFEETTSEPGQIDIYAGHWIKA